MKYNNVRKEEIETIRSFHKGEFGRCPKCGRAAYLPCLACVTEERGGTFDPIDVKSLKVDDLGIELYGEQRKRYEAIRHRKIKAERLSQHLGSES